MICAKRIILFSRNNFENLTKLLQSNILNTSFYREKHGLAATHKCGLTTTASNFEANILQSKIYYLSQRRSVGFFNKLPADHLWKGVTSVSNAGKNRGRGKGNKKIRAKNLNKGQYIGSGEENYLFPGLNTSVTRGKELVQREKLPKDEDRQKKLNEIRNKMGLFKPLKLHPLERGWTGAKLGGRKLGPPPPIGDDHFTGFESIILEAKIVTKMTGNLGRKRSASIFVVTGNKNGLAGIGLGKANTYQGAMKKALAIAGQRLIYFDRCENHTVFHDFHTHFMSSQIFVKRKQEGYGLVCHRAIREMCAVIGIKDIHAKIEGGINVQNIAKAFIMGLLEQKTFKQLADEKNLYVGKIRPNAFPEIVAAPKGHVRSQDEIPMDEELDFKLYTMKGRVEMERKKFVPFYTRLPSYEVHLKKQLKSRSHYKIKKQLLLEYGELVSFLTEKNPECRPGFKIEEKD